MVAYIKQADVYIGVYSFLHHRLHETEIAKLVLLCLLNPDIAISVHTLHCSLSVPGQIIVSPPLVAQLRRNQADVGRCLATFVDSMSTLVDSGPVSVEFGRVVATIADSWASLAEIGPTWAEVGGISAEWGRHRHSFGRCKAKLVGCRSSLPTIWLSWPECEQMRPVSAQCRKSTRTPPNSGDFHQTWPEDGKPGLCAKK